MIYWKEECKRLAVTNALIAIVDSYDEHHVPVFVIRRVVGATGSRNGKNSYWSVMLDEPLSDGCNAVTYPYVLATRDSSSEHGTVIDSIRMDQYHPSWILSKELERELEWRKESAIHGLKAMVNYSK